MTISYNIIFKKFLGRVQDITFLSLPTEVANEFMVEWLHAVASKPHVRKLFSQIILDDEIEIIDCVVYQSVDKYYDNDFIMEVFIEGLMIEWLSREVDNISNIKQLIGGAEEKFYAQANHLSQINDLLIKHQQRQRKLTMNFGYDFEVMKNREA